MAAIDKLIAEVRANPPHPKSPLPWKTHAEYGDVSDSGNVGVVADIEQANAGHIVAAVNAIGPLIKEVGRLQSLLDATGVQQIDGGWKIMVGNSIGLGATPGDAIEAVIDAEAHRRTAESREEANFYRELHNKTCPTVDKFVYGSCNCRLSVQIERNRLSAGSGSNET